MKTDENPITIEDDQPMKTLFHNSKWQLNTSEETIQKEMSLIYYNYQTNSMFYTQNASKIYAGSKPPYTQW